MTVQIGQLTNVPAPGDDIRSPWAQDLTRLARHTFATKAALDAATWPGLADGMAAFTVDDQRRWYRYGGAWISEPKGILGYVERLAAAGPLSNVETAIGGLALAAFTLPTARRVRINFACRSVNGIAGDVVLLRLKDNGVTQLQEAQIVMGAGGAGDHVHMMCAPVLAAGAHTIALYGLHAVGNNTANIIANVGLPATLLAEDIGA